MKHNAFLTPKKKQGTSPILRSGNQFRGDFWTLETFWRSYWGVDARDRVKRQALFDKKWSFWVCHTLLT